MRHVGKSLFTTHTRSVVCTSDICSYYGYITIVAPTILLAPFLIYYSTAADTIFIHWFLMFVKFAVVRFLESMF